MMLHRHMRSTRSRRSTNRHGRTRGRIVAPVEEIRRNGRDGWVHGGWLWVGLRCNRRDAKKPEDTADGWRKAAHDRATERCRQRQCKPLLPEGVRKAARALQIASIQHGASTLSRRWMLSVEGCLQKLHVD